MEAETAMHYKTFDTHKYIKSLQETGFNEKQAEMLVKSLLESRDFDLSILATREQVSKLGVSLDKKIDNIEARLEKQIIQVKSDLQKEIANVKSDLQKEISATRDQVTKVEAKLEKKIDRIEAKLDSFKWVTPLIFTTMAMIAALIIKLFF